MISWYMVLDYRNLLHVHRVQVLVTWYQSLMAIWYQSVGTGDMVQQSEFTGYMVKECRHLSILTVCTGYMV